MKVLFISLQQMEDIGDHTIYNDLLLTFAEHGHRVTAICPRERRTELPTCLSESEGIRVLKVATNNIQKTSSAAKAFGLSRLKRQYEHAIRCCLPNETFDLILFVTPPTVLSGFINRLRRQSSAKSYLLLKDIFPQNAIDLGMLKTKGILGLIYRYYKHTERATYRSADWIGCLSEANRKYLLAHEPEISGDTVEVNPNSLIPHDIPKQDSLSLRKVYHLPFKERLLLFGGNLGKPQAIDYLIDVLRLNEESPVGYFVIAGNGTERYLLEEFFQHERPQHACLLKTLPREEFASLTAIVDAGIIILDHRFTIPNYPSRLLSYMQASKPVFVASDTVCDVGPDAQRNGYGLWCESTSPSRFLDMIGSLSNEELEAMGERARSFFLNNFTTEITYERIMRHFDE
jgi:glycosyltransferase involved in cell wall biosynthesis